MKRSSLRRVRGGKRAVRKSARTARAAERTAPRMVWQLALSGVLFVALIALKLAMPGHLTSLRGTLADWLVNDADFVSAFSAVGRAASGEQPLGDSLSEAYTAVFGETEQTAQEVSADLADLSAAAPAETASPRDLPACAVGEQRVLGFSYASPLSGTMTSPFGWREDPTTGEEAFHYGLDLAGAEGDAVSCFADGTVGVVGESTILGRYLTVDHANGFSSLYAHCSAVTVSSGQAVEKGQRIASVGSTGNATGPHLHFELHEGSSYLNPVYYVAS